MTTVDRMRRPRGVAGGLARGDASRRPRWPAAAAGLLLVAAVVVAARAAARGSHVDLEVYRRAGERWLQGTDPYAVRPELPFTYPPVAAALSGLVAAAPALAAVVLAVLAVASAGAAAALAARDGGRFARPVSAGDPRRWTDLAGAPVILAVALAVASEPVLRTLELGQVNGLLLALVLVDQLVLPHRWRGWLTGVAVGLKLTPLAFVLVALVRRDWAVVRRLGAAALSTALAGAVLVPGSTTTYWGGLVVDAPRIGAPGFVDNQSLLGAATRVAPGAATMVWLLASAAAVGLALVALHRARAGPPLVPVLVCGLVACLVSPISWSHHWLLLPAVVTWCWWTGHRLTAVVGTGALAVPFVAVPGLDLPVIVSGLLANAGAIAGVVALAALAQGPSRWTWAVAEWAARPALTRREPCDLDQR